MDKMNTALTCLLLCIKHYEGSKLKPDTDELVLAIAREYNVNALDLKWSLHDYRQGLIKLPYSYLLTTPTT